MKALAASSVREVAEWHGMQKGAAQQRRTRDNMTAHTRTQCWMEIAVAEGVQNTMAVAHAHDDSTTSFCPVR